MKRIASCLVALSLLIVAVQAAELKVGDAAPSFSMQASDGHTYTLDQFKGKKAVVIAWYPKSFTGGCTKECKSMKTYGAELKALNVAYFTASCDPVDVQKKFAESLEVDYPILADPSKEAAKAFGVSDGGNAKRHTIFIDKNGKVAHVEIKVNTETHGKDIAAKLKELGIAN